MASWSNGPCVGVGLRGRLGAGWVESVAWRDAWNAVAAFDGQPAQSAWRDNSGQDAMQLNARIGGRNVRRDVGSPLAAWGGPSAGFNAGAFDGRTVLYSVVVPVYNSAPILPELHRRLTLVLAALGRPYEIIFVDDCGPQDCWPVLCALAQGDGHVKAIQLMRNAGQSNATLCGLAQAQGELVVMMDDDLQHPPEQLPRLIEALTPQVDVVMGVPLVNSTIFSQL